MSGDIALTSALRNNLLNLQNTQRQADQTQFRLSTGKKVNSALDNPLNFFRAQSFGNRASDLSGLLDGINLSIRTIEEADKGISAINKLLDTSESIIEEAKTAYNGSSTNVATIRGLQTAGGAAVGTTTLGALRGGIAGFSTGDSLTVTIYAEGTTTTTTLASSDTVDDLIAAFSTGTATFTDFGAPLVTGAIAGGDVTLTAADVSAIERIEITITGDTDDTDPRVNFGGSISRQSSGTTTLYNGLETTLQNLEERYDKVLTEISATANDAGYNGINLLKGNDLLTTFNEDGTSALSTTGDDLTAIGMGLSLGDFSTRALVDTSATQLNDANRTVRNFGNLIATDLSLIQTRRDFTEGTVETLKAGADDLTLADLNEEGANLLALQTRQQLGVTALSLASQSQQGVLRLF